MFYSREWERICKLSKVSFTYNANSFNNDNLFNFGETKALHFWELKRGISRDWKLLCSWMIAVGYRISSQNGFMSSCISLKPMSTMQKMPWRVCIERSHAEAHETACVQHNFVFGACNNGTSNWCLRANSDTDRIILGFIHQSVLITCWNSLACTK